MVNGRSLHCPEVGQSMCPGNEFHSLKPATELLTALHNSAYEPMKGVFFISYQKLLWSRVLGFCTVETLMHHLCTRPQAFIWYQLKISGIPLTNRFQTGTRVTLQKSPWSCVVCETSKLFAVWLRNAFSLLSSDPNKKRNVPQLGSPSVTGRQDNDRQRNIRLLIFTSCVSDLCRRPEMPDVFLDHPRPKAALPDWILHPSPGSATYFSISATDLESMRTFCHSPRQIP